jgi:anti-sigma factor RsiW
MSCETVIGSIVALFDGELTGDERAAVESHLASCRACAREAEDLRATRIAVARHLTGLETRIAEPRFADVWQRVACDSSSEAAAEVHEHRASAARSASVSRPRRGRGRWVVAGTSVGLGLAAGLALMVVARSPSQDVGPASDGGKPRTVAAVRAPEAVVAKPAKAPATRVAKSGPAQPAKEQVARRTDPKPATDATAQDAPHEEAVAAAEPHEEAVAVNELDPPRELLDRPDLFLNYPIMRKLDELRHLDAVMADQGVDDQPDDGGAG